MASTFFDRMDELAERVGHGRLVGKVEVDQVYAKYQHERADLEHPRGGKWHYLTDPLLSGAEASMRTVAKHTLEPDGPQQGMREVVDGLVSDVHTEAPREFNDLRRSGHALVVSNGEIVYDRPPEVERLDEAQLRAKNELRRAGFTP